MQGTTVTANGTLTVTDSITNYGTINGNGSVTGTADNNKLVVINAGTIGCSSLNASSIEIVDTSTLSGTISVGSFKADNLGGKTLTVNGTVNVTGDDSLNVSGTSTSSRLTIGGSGSFNFTTKPTKHVGQYLQFATQAPTVETNGPAKISYSIDSTGGTNVPFGWELDNTFVWLGTKSEKLNEPENWEGGRIPGDGDDEVSIIVKNGNNPFTLIASTTDKKLHNLTIEKDATTVVPDGAKLIISGECKNNGSLLIKGIVEFSES